mgnify:CR=1 FL=1
MSSNDLEGDDIWGDSGGSGNDGDDNQKDGDKQGSSSSGGTAEVGTSTNMDTTEETKEQQEDELLEDDETRHMTVGELRQRIHLLNNDIRVMKSDVQRITHESRAQRDSIRENQEKIKVNKQLPFLVANVVEVLEPDAEDGTLSFLALCCVVDGQCVIDRRNKSNTETPVCLLFAHHDYNCPLTLYFQV